MSLDMSQYKQETSSDKRFLLEHQVTALLNVLTEIHGHDQLVIKAGKLDSLELMESDKLEDRVLALERLIYEDPTIVEQRSLDEAESVLEDLEENIAELLARRTVEDRLEQKINAKMQERHLDYIKEIRMQVLKEEAGPDNAQTLKKYAELEVLESRSLAHSTAELMRPRTLEEVVGQDAAIKSLLSKLSSPSPSTFSSMGLPVWVKQLWPVWRCSMPRHVITRPLWRMLPLWKWMGQPCAGIRGK